MKDTKQVKEQAAHQKQKEIKAPQMSVIPQNQKKDVKPKQTAIEKKLNLSPEKVPKKVQPQKQTTKQRKEFEELMEELSMEFSSESSLASPEKSAKRLLTKDVEEAVPLKSKFASHKMKLSDHRPLVKLDCDSPERIQFEIQNFTKATSAGLVRSKIYDPNHEIEALKHELKLRDSELQRLTLAKDYSQKSHDSTFHLAFMFASPLVRKVGQKLENIMKLDYLKEITGIEKALKDVKHEVRYKVDVATISNFRSVVADAPFALHFTGHGIQNNYESLGSSFKLFKDKGNILLLEEENGMADYLFENDLQRLVEISRANRSFTYNYEVVFVSSCHSEFAGNIFLASGAHHVICIMRSETISDKASLRFSKVFYQTLFMKKYSV